MRVLYDITVLGNASRYLWQRTGVFRVVDEVARQLAQADNCSLSFCCAVNPEVTDDAWNYIQGDKVLHDVPLIRNEDPRCESGILHRMLRRSGRVQGLNGHELKNMDIFHAPAFYLPTGLEKAKAVKAFLTIYDLIPILYPKLCREGSREFVEQALAGLRPGRRAICISTATKNDLCNLLPALDPRMAFVIPLAASDAFYPCADLNLQSQVRRKYGVPDAPYFLSLSTLEPRKNIEHAIRCFSRLVNESRLTDTNLVLVGEKGWDYEAIFRTLEEPQIPKRQIILTGYVADEDLAPLYSGAVAFIYPSLYEGFGLPPLEAMKSGTPVITSNVSSLPEVVGDAGIMVSPTDEDALCQAMMQYTKMIP